MGERRVLARRPGHLGSRARPRTRETLRDLVIRLDLRGALITDAVLAALCIEHGLEIVSADSDFARFTELTWINPVA